MQLFHRDLNYKEVKFVTPLTPIFQECKQDLKHALLDAISTIFNKYISVSGHNLSINNSFTKSFQFRLMQLCLMHYRIH